MDPKTKQQYEKSLIKYCRGGGGGMSAYATALSESSREALIAECLRQRDRATELEAEVARLTNRLDRLRDIGEDMRNQDNLATACPVFMVQRRRRIYGLDPDYADTFVWLSDDGDYEAEEAEIPALEAEHDRTGADEHGGFRRLAYVDIWENVQPFFTRHGAARYLVVNGHNLRPETRIYVESGWRNQEWEDIRAALLALAGEVEE